MINIDTVRLSIDTNGPGRRIVIWTQGCTLNCDGCFNQEQLIHEANKLFDIKELFEILIGLLIKYNCEGVTISGGEPFQQAKAVLELGKLVKQKGYSLVIFSGYTYKQLKESKNHEVRELLKLGDIMILGRYNRNNTEERTWFNNKDKKIIYNSDQYINYSFDVNPNIEFTIIEDTMLISGFPDRQTFEELKNLLNKSNIETLDDESVLGLKRK